jgi:transcriptional regulator with XRE-family HTH domain
MASDSSRAFGFGQRLQAARQAKEMSGTDLGKGLQPEGNATRQTVSDWENERHLPNVWQLREICLRLKVSADYLLFGQQGMTPEMLEAHAAMQKLTLEQRRVVLGLPLPESDEAAAAFRNAVDKSKPRSRTKPAAKRTTKKPRKSD